MSDKVHEFEGEHARVTWDAKRCIHAAECVHGLPMVFEPGRRPWIIVGRVRGDVIAEVVMRCPTGALHFERKDGGAPEPVPAENTVRVSPSGPLHVRGDVEVLGPDGAPLLRDTRVGLCRCGGSQNMPFCDNAHLSRRFHDPGEVFEGGVHEDAEAPATGALRVVVEAGGPLRVTGPLTVVSADGRVKLAGNRVALCRCGHSRNKPFCDGSHETAGFERG